MIASRTRLLALCLGLVPFLASCELSAPRLVLVLVVDTLRADRLGCYGYEEIETPNIDRLAAEGTLYTNAYTSVPVTLPSVATLLTGAYPTQHGLRDNGPYQLSDGWETLAEAFSDAGFATGAFVSAAVLDPAHNLDQGFEVYDADVSARYQAYDPLLRSAESRIQGIERRAELTVDAALAWLEPQRDRDVLLFVHLFDPHLPRDPPPPFDELYAGRPYEGEIAYADREIGRLLAGIESRWSRRGLTVVFLADHGEGLGDHGEMLHGDLLFDPTTRVPLVVRGPAVHRGKQVADLVRTADVFPTISALLGLPQPMRSIGRPLPGIGLASPESTAPGRLGRTAYLETFRPRLSHGWSELRALRTDRWKLVEGPELELYDLGNDPGEREDVAELHPELRDSLAALLDEVAFLSVQRGADFGETLELTREQRDRLASLGYLTGGATGPAATDSLAVFGFPAAARGRTLGLTHPQDRVEASYRRVVANSFYLSGRAELDAGFPTRAAERFRAAMRADPTRVDTYLAFAEAADSAGRSAAALDGLRQGLRSVPGDLHLLTALAPRLARVGRTEEALRLIDEALAEEEADSALTVLRRLRLRIQRSTRG